ncbi:MAG: GDSL-type esterase/lipase family protein [Caldilineaceae bacterium]
MSEKIERLKRAIKVGLLTGQTQVDRIRLRSRNGQPPLILFLGDSRAKAWPAPALSHPAIFLNRGVGFDTSRQVLQRLSAHVTPLRPQIVLLQAGINDCKALLLAPPNHAIMVQETLATLRQIAEQICEVGAHLVLTTIFPVAAPNTGSNAFWGANQPDAAARVRDAVAQINRGLMALNAADITIFDAAPLLQNTDGWLDPAYARDELHINTAGYQKLNQVLGPLLQNIAT